MGDRWASDDAKALFEAESTRARIEKEKSHWMQTLPREQGLETAVNGFPNERDDPRGAAESRGSNRLRDANDQPRDNMSDGPTTTQTDDDRVLMPQHNPS